MRRLLTVIAALALAGSILPAAAESHDGETTLTAFDAAVIDGALEVTGAADFAGTVDFLVSNNGTEHLDPDAQMLLGYKVEQVLISQPDPSTGDLVFTWEMEDVLTSLVPEILQYYWDFGIRTAGGTSVDLQIDGKVSTAATLASPSFRIRANCGTEGNLFSCEQNLGAVEATVDLDTNRVSVAVPAQLLEGVPELEGQLDGSRIVGVKLFSGIAVQPSLVAANASDFGYEMIGPLPFTSGRHVTVALLDAEGQLVKNAAGKILPPVRAEVGDGEFASVIDVSEVLAGDYTVTVTACYGTNCAPTGEVPVTIG